jgi:hypothetical protein
MHHTRRQPKKSPWDDQGAFRETMLVFFSDEILETCIRPFGQILYDLSLETTAFDDRNPDVTGRELLAGAKDLRHLHGFFRAIAEAGGAGDSARARELARLARTLARDVRRLAIATERGLAAARRCPCQEECGS